jgi:pimeloyl-ACP methyl ester carboxylesterase
VCTRDGRGQPRCRARRRVAAFDDACPRVSVGAVRVDVGGDVRLFVDVDGPGLVTSGPVMRERPTLLLLHGGPAMDSSIFRGSGLDRLTDVAQIVLYDHRGTGRSDRRRAEEWNLDTWADDVVALCDALGIVKPIVLGSSFGGMVAQRYLARHPDHPDRVILAGTAARLDLDLVGAAFARLGGDHAGDIARRFLAGDASLSDEYDAHCLPLYATSPLDPDQFTRTLANEALSVHFKREWNATDLRPGLAAARCPVLVIGAELDPICPPAAVAELVEALPVENATFVALAGQSHLEAAVTGISDVVRTFIVEPS